MGEVPLSAMDILEDRWGREWWKGGTRETINGVLDDMLQVMNEDSAIDCLLSVMFAMADEYGD